MNTLSILSILTKNGNERMQLCDVFITSPLKKSFSAFPLVDVLKSIKILLQQHLLYNSVNRETGNEEFVLVIVKTFFAGRSIVITFISTFARGATYMRMNYYVYLFASYPF